MHKDDRLLELGCFGAFAGLRQNFCEDHMLAIQQNIGLLIVYNFRCVLQKLLARSKFTFQYLVQNLLATAPS